jgi:hypothetical protein
LVETSEFDGRLRMPAQLQVKPPAVWPHSGATT